MTKNIVIIDGKAFDADTGLAVLHQPVKTEAKTKTKATTEAKTEQLATKLEASSAKPQAKPNQKAYAAGELAERLHQRTQAPMTLNRDYVSEPKLAKLKPKAATVSLNQAKLAASPKPQLVKRGKYYNTSEAEVKIQRFPDNLFYNPTKEPIVVAKQTLPDQTITPKEQAELEARLRQARKLNIENRLRIARIQRQRERLRRHQVEVPHSLQSNIKAAKRLRSHLSQMDSADYQKLNQRYKQQLIDKALRDAPSSQELRANSQFQPKTTSRLAFNSLLVGATACLLAIGYIGYLNWPNLNFRIAANQSNFEVGMPKYSPQGFRLAQVATGKDLIRLTYRKQQQNFSITQEPTELTDQTLARQAGEDYRTASQTGRAIYQRSGQATWIKDGVLYTLNGQDLSSEDIYKIADSLN